MNNGEKTAEFGDELIKEYDGKNGYEIYHDHGSKDAKNGHVCAVKLVMGEELSNSKRISDVDIAILQNRKVIALIEIEESGTLSPKKLFGDYFSLVLADTLYINKDKYSINKETSDNQTRFIIGGLYKESGDTKSKITELEKRLNKLLGDNSEKNRKKVEIIKEKDITNLIDSIRKELQKILQK